MSNTNEYFYDETNNLSIIDDDLVAEADRICRERLGDVDIRTLPPVNEVAVNLIVERYIHSSSSLLLKKRPDADINMKEKIQYLENKLELKNKEVAECKEALSISEINNARLKEEKENLAKCLKDYLSSVDKLRLVLTEVENNIDDNVRDNCKQNDSSTIEQPGELGEITVKDTPKSVKVSETVTNENRIYKKESTVSDPLMLCKPID